MGLFSRFKRSKKQDTKEEKVLIEEENLYKEAEIVPQKVMSVTNIAECCEQMLEANRQIAQMKQEYEVVTSSLTDIQRIDLMPEEEHLVLEREAKDIVIFTNEQKKYKIGDTKITASQRNMVERQENFIAKELKDMRKSEEYNGIIKSDLHHLEGEKGALLFEKSEIIQKQRFLKKMAVTMVFLAVSLIILIGVFSYAFNQDMAIPYILTIILSAVSGIYIFTEANKNRRQMQIAERKLHRAITLLNKTKIKYINNRSLLEYSYDKYEVSTSAELEYIWKQYLIVREREKKYQLNTDKLNEAKAGLTALLEMFNLYDAKLWTHQAEAIIDKKEMVEVRHHLNVRRQKLRDNLDYNSKNYTVNQKLIIEFMEENKNMRDEIMDILRNYGVEL